MTNPTPHGQVPAIQRYKIGYHSDEWGVRSLSPTGIYDDAGPWVRYEDHAAALHRLHAENEALRTQQQAPAGEESKPHGWLYDWTHSSATGKPDTTCTGFTKDEAHARKHDNCIAVFTTPQPAPTTQQAGEVVAYLDIGAGGYLDLGSALSDEALQQLPKGRHALVIAGTYGIDGYVAAPQPSPEAQPAPAAGITVEQVEDAIGLQSTAWDTIGAEKIVEAVLRLANAKAPARVLEDAARWHWMAEYLVGTRTDLDDDLIASATVDELRKLVDADLATRKQGEKHGR